MAYKRTVEDHLADKNPHQVWQGLKQLTNYNSSVAVGVDASLIEELNHFLDRFETTSPQTATLPPLFMSPLTIQEHQVRSKFRFVNTRKATDGIPASKLKAWAIELSVLIS